LPDWPACCPLGHPLAPGKISLSWAHCSEPCGGPAAGHHYLYCTTCNARLWLEHTGAEWEVRFGARYVPFEG
jgi:hypothetical protein